MSMTFETDDVTSSIRQVLHGQFKGEINHSTGTFFFFQVIVMTTHLTYCSNFIDQYLRMVSLSVNRIVLYIGKKLTMG